MFVELLPEGDISVVGLVNYGLVTYHHASQKLRLYFKGSDDCSSQIIQRSKVWRYLVSIAPEIQQAYIRQHYDPAINRAWEKEE